MTGQSRVACHLHKVLDLVGCEDFGLLFEMAQSFLVTLEVPLAARDECDTDST